MRPTPVGQTPHPHSGCPGQAVLPPALSPRQHERLIVTLPLLAKAGLAGALVAGTVAGLTSMSADARDGLSVVNVPTASPRTGIEFNVIPPAATETSVAWGALPLTNP